MGELASKHTALVLDRGPTKGVLTVFDDRLEFVADHGGPALTIVRDTIYAVVAERRFLVKDRMRIKTAAGDFLFSEGYRELHLLLAGPAHATRAAASAT